MSRKAVLGPIYGPKVPFTQGYRLVAGNLSRKGKATRPKLSNMIRVTDGVGIAIRWSRYKKALII